MEVHLGVIKLHPLHFTPFVKVCFTCKHILDLMGPCISHLIANLMLGLHHTIYFIWRTPNSLRDSNVSPKQKTAEKQGVKARSLLTAL